jgi:hypothetical protein
MRTIIDPHTELNTFFRNSPSPPQHDVLCDAHHMISPMAPIISDPTRLFTVTPILLPFRPNPTQLRTALRRVGVHVAEAAWGFARTLEAHTRIMIIRGASLQSPFHGEPSASPSRAPSKYDFLVLCTDGRPRGRYHVQRLGRAERRQFQEWIQWAAYVYNACRREEGTPCMGSVSGYDAQREVRYQGYCKRDDESVKPVRTRVVNVMCWALC